MITQLQDLQVLWFLLPWGQGQVLTSHIHCRPIFLLCLGLTWTLSFFIHLMWLFFSQHPSHPHQGLDLKNVSFILIPHLVSWGLIALENLASYFIEKLSSLFLKACLSLHFLHPLPPPYSTGTPSHYWFFLFHFFQAISITRSLCSDKLHQSQISSPPNFVLGFPLSLFLSALQFGFYHLYSLKLLFWRSIRMH